ncbi:Zn-ribbon domain-containing protein [Halorarum halobium]|uniref:Zn-ribbon domain-containing protein n=1 Tax=Halorarum halobium TaxID=3075121 RepID=UPI0028A9F03B|nr:Zn-ribbon containing protein [Halobaculum sp. XH14]
MPHQCTNCGRTFADGSKEMLSGCPNCGSNKFQFRPGGTADAGDPADASHGTGGGAAGDAAAGGADGIDTGDGSAADATDAGAGASAADPDATTTDAEQVGPGEEDGAQAAARSEMVSSADLPSDGDDSRRWTPPETGASGGPGAAGSGEDGDDGQPAGENDPDLAALREKLNDQFESIRILNPGQYELNLMELYDRDEYIISLREDGRYVIEMPETWGPEDE